MSPGPVSWLVPGESDRVLHVGAGRGFSSVADARNAIRRLSPGERTRCPIRVLIHAGVHALDEPLTFLPEDSGTPDCPIIYAAAPGERPVITGAVRLRGWRKTTVAGRDAWVLTMPGNASADWAFSWLFVNGKRRLRPRLPKHGFSTFVEAPPDYGDWARFAPGAMRNWRNLADVEVVALHYWVESRLPVASVDEQAGRVTFGKKSAWWFADETKTGGCRYWVENVFEALEEPGQFYLDRADGLIYYLPMPGEDPDATEVRAARLSQLVRFEGASEENCVHDLHMVGLDFRHTEWRYPDDKSGSPQASVGIPGAIVYRHARDCSFRLNRVSQVMSYSVEIAEGCRRIAVVGNSLHELGAGGVTVRTGSSHSFISDNVIRQGGRHYASAVGILVADSGHNTLQHNEIDDFYYSGISAGWIWSYDPGSRARYNLIANNRIRRIGQGVLSDLGGIYLLGVSPGTRVSGNWISEVEAFCYNGCGIYLDAGVTHVVVERNLVVDVSSNSLHSSNGRDDVVRNNLFAGSRDVPIKWGTTVFCPFRVERNVVLAASAAAAGPWDERLPLPEFQHNLYWSPCGDLPTFDGADWQGWRTHGFDAGSLNADPLLCDAGAGAFVLRADSPALALGIEPPEPAAAGPRASVLSTGQAGPGEAAAGCLVWSYIAPAGASPQQISSLEGSFDCPDFAPCRLRMQAVFENAGDGVFCGDVGLQARSPDHADWRPAVASTITLAPGQRRRLELDLDVPDGTPGVLLETTCPDECCWRSRRVVRFRRRANVLRLPDGLPVEGVARALADAGPLEVRKGDWSLGSFLIGSAGERLALHVEVFPLPPRPPSTGNKPP